jgi:glycosyltransferase involved in cell wall biosynthesis
MKDESKPDAGRPSSLLSHPSSLRVVVATPDVVGVRMAGPGIRAWQMARALGKRFDTTLVARQEGDVPGNDLRVLNRGSDDAREALRAADVLIGQPARHFGPERRGQRVIYDLFDPVLLELRELYGRYPSLRQRVHYAAEAWRVRRAVGEGDALLVATAKQRELYRAGATPMVEVPFGVDPVDILPGDRPRSDLIVWGGGTWEWLDPNLAVDAAIQLNREGVACRLLFLGRSRPNRALADRRRVDRFDMMIGRGAPWVEANSDWTPYSERMSWLRPAKIAMMLHRPTTEAAYSIRTRIFDAIAAAVPVITTDGGFAADLVAAEGLGIVVPPSDVSAVAAAVRRLLRDDDFHASCVRNLERIRPRFGWQVVTAPLAGVLEEWQKREY